MTFPPVVPVDVTEAGARTSVDIDLRGDLLNYLLFYTSTDCGLLNGLLFFLINNVEEVEVKDCCYYERVVFSLFIA